MTKPPGQTENSHLPAALSTDQRAAPEDLALLARELPDLEILRPLRAGRTGRVFLAREPRLSRLVAVKVLAPDLAGDHVARTRFEREARAAAALNHPNAVVVHRFGYLSSGVPYLVMQYVKGGTLEDKLAAEGVLSVLQARQVLAEVADALAAAHRSGFVHRDLRPNNVLCDEEGCRALVSDFGLAGVLPEVQGSDSRITRAGELLGEPEYISPEQLRGEDASEASDVYALGVMGYHLLAGEGPFAARRGPALMNAHLRESPRSLRSLRPEVEQGLAELLERCLAKEPLKRPRAAYLAQALRESGASPAAQAAAATAGHASQADVMQDLLRRRLPQSVAATLAVGLGAISFVGLLTEKGVPDLVFWLTLVTSTYGVAAAGVIAWFHGRPGRQRAPSIELGLLGLVAVAWLLTCLALALAW